MKTTPKHNERIAKMPFASVYPHYIAKVEKKGRTKEELHQVIKWLTGFDENKLQELINEKVTFETFFQKAKINPNLSISTTKPSNKNLLPALVKSNTLTKRPPIHSKIL